MKSEKLFVIRKYVKATSARDAIKKEKKQEVDDCWIDEKWIQEEVVEGFRKRKQ